MLVVRRAELPAPKVATGPATILGYLGAIGAVLAALEGNDVATAVGGIALIVSQLGRYAQAVMIARTVAGGHDRAHRRARREAVGGRGRRPARRAALTHGVNSTPRNWTRPPRASTMLDTSSAVAPPGAAALLCVQASPD